MTVSAQPRPWSITLIVNGREPSTGRSVPIAVGVTQDVGGAHLTLRVENGPDIRLTMAEAALLRHHLATAVLEQYHLDADSAS
ncbi:hypothetical protein SAMN05421504_101554 [Amycolatopsis xylanica]|uniref:Uncharacterized protein n=1 Tax=Amycolatopsis xylanica TaxID=589385 RepID=A0A1H2TGI0_9PSEU|nr:hypothetical protein [Amycolatopsis xylanica]SDW42877.1 hypothetical protein SAMN05421504_101554 [Amycolatopsis xylanica]